MKAGRWSVSAVWAVVGLTTLALAPAAAANHGITELVSTNADAGEPRESYDATSKGISQDGTHVFFDTKEALLWIDDDFVTDAFGNVRNEEDLEDVYERVGDSTFRVSDGYWNHQAGSYPHPAAFSGASGDGSRVFFSTQQPLEPSDSDNAIDVYERSGGATTQVSQGPSGGNAFVDATFIRASEDGGRVFFSTAEQMVAADTDGSQDIYERSGGTTTLVSTPSCGDCGSTPTLDAISADGTRAFFTTIEPLVASDTDSRKDIYERSGGTTTLVSTGPTGSIVATDAVLGGVSRDGTRVFFKTGDTLVGADTDSYQDVYERTGGTTTLVSTGPTGGNGTTNAAFSANSHDGTRVFFTTQESIVNGDTDAESDVYERAGGTTTLVSTGPAAGSGSVGATLVGTSADGARAFFTTDEGLVSGDADGSVDIYERAGGTTTLVTDGLSPGLQTFEAASADGSRVFFSTDESLVSADTDAGASDIYERAGGTTTLISNGPRNPQTSEDASFGRVSQDGGHVVFETAEKLVDGDTDGGVFDVGEVDVYVASTGVTTGFARPKGATPLRVPLVPSYEECTGGNRTHGGPLAFASCNPPAPTSNFLTVGTPDANGKVANSIGSVKWSAAVGNPSTAADEADIAIALSLTDVRMQSDLSDYAGELRVSTSLRVTDRLNSSSLTLPGTVTDMPFAFTAPCAPTTDTALGGACTLNTTLDGLIGGAVKEGKRSIYELGDIEVFDGGADGDGETVGDNTLFAGSGLFVP